MPFDLGEDCLRTPGVAMGHQPARALGDPKAHHEYHEADEGPDQEREAPTNGRVNDFGIEQHESSRPRRVRPQSRSCR